MASISKVVSLAMAAAKRNSPMMSTSLSLSYNVPGRPACRCGPFLSVGWKNLTSGIATGFVGNRTGVKRLAHNGNIGEGKPPPVVESGPLADQDQIRADHFLKSLMAAQYEEVPGTSQMQVLRGVYDLETGKPNVDMIVRSITAKFWKRCIETVDTAGWRFRVVAVGSSGIGKTFTTPILIRLLLEAGHTVVYLIRADKSQGWFYEFSGGTGGPFSARVYPERTDKLLIPSLQLASTYYVVDPGDTTDSSDPPSDFSPKVIIVSPPDSRHWGDNEFQKLRVKVAGFFRVYPTWTLDELLDAQPIICPAISKDDVLRRFHQFGGIPEYVFEDDEEDLLERQNRDVNSLREHDVENIALGLMHAVSSFESSAPKSTIVGFELARDDHGMFESEVVAVPPAVQEKIFSRFIVNLWYLVSSGQGNASFIFESYARWLFTGRIGASLSLPSRNRFDDDGRDTFFYHPFPRCQEVQTVVDLFSTVFSADTRSLVLYHTSKSSRELFNMAYKVASKKTVYLIRTSVDEVLDSNSRHHEEFLKKMDMVDAGWHLYVLYLVPSEKFHSFKTNPRRPFANLNRRRSEPVIVMHVAVPNPALKMDALMAQLTRSSREQDD
jgi:hypothetical protein